MFDIFTFQCTACSTECSTSDRYLVDGEYVCEDCAPDALVETPSARETPFTDAGGRS